MRISNNDNWKLFRKNNTDPYGKACVDFAEAWADAMETKMQAGRLMPEIARECASEVDARPGFGISGFMYGAAVSILSQCWEHGEELRRWHNVDLAGEEGAASANKQGQVLNPALLAIVVPDA